MSSCLVIQHLEPESSYAISEALATVRIEGHDLPGRSCGPSPERPEGHRGIEVGVQRRNRPDELLGQVRADVDLATWELDAEVVPVGDGLDVRGPHISGPPGARFVYLSSGMGDGSGWFELFRPAKLMLDAVPPGVLADASELGMLVGRLGLTDPKGNPL
jgi:hypothetical protein